MPIPFTQMKYLVGDLTDTDAAVHGIFAPTKSGVRETGATTTLRSSRSTVGIVYKLESEFLARAMVRGMSGTPRQYLKSLSWTEHAQHWTCVSQSLYLKLLIVTEVANGTMASRD